VPPPFLVMVTAVPASARPLFKVSVPAVAPIDALPAKVILPFVVVRLLVPAMLSRAPLRPPAPPPLRGIGGALVIVRLPVVGWSPRVPARVLLFWMPVLVAFCDV